MIDFPFDHDEEVIKDRIAKWKEIYDRKYFHNTEDKKFNLVHWRTLNDLIKPLVEELNDIQDWRRRTAGRSGDSRPLPLHK